jgi:tRNA(Ile)-lysidine synthase
VRYGFLEEVRRAAGARWIATAHHRDDQAETVLLRLAQGSGVEGLAGVRPVHGAVVRPLLETARRDLLRIVEDAGLPAADDPGNRDLGPARNRIRHLLLPALAAGDPGLPELLGRLAGRARGARAALGRRLEPALQARPAEGGVAIPCAAFLALPPELQPLALAALHRRAGAPYPAGAAARGELLGQLARAAGAAGGRRRVGCDAGRGWRWERRRELLVLLPPGEAPPGAFHGAPAAATGGSVPGDLAAGAARRDEERRQARITPGVTGSHILDGA